MWYLHSAEGTAFFFWSKDWNILVTATAGEGEPVIENPKRVIQRPRNGFLDQLDLIPLILCNLYILFALFHFCDPDGIIFPENTFHHFCLFFLTIND